VLLMAATSCPSTEAVMSTPDAERVKRLLTAAPPERGPVALATPSTNSENEAFAAWRKTTRQ
jgi:hypothetical protein